MDAFSLLPFSFYPHLGKVISVFEDALPVRELEPTREPVVRSLQTGTVRVWDGTYMTVPHPRPAFCRKAM